MNIQPTESQTEQGKALMRAILLRSAADLEFRQQLLSHPESAVAEHLGIASSDLPEPFALTFTEQPGASGVCLPDYTGPGAEIAESELEAVSGGVLGGAALVHALLQLIDTYSQDQCRV